MSIIRGKDFTPPTHERLSTIRLRVTASYYDKAPGKPGRFREIPEYKALLTVADKKAAARLWRRIEQAIRETVLAETSAKEAV